MPEVWRLPSLPNPLSASLGSAVPGVHGVRTAPSAVAPVAAVAALAAGGLVGGFAAARYSHRRELGGLVFAAAGAWCAREWARTSGPAGATPLVAGYVAAMGGSHPLAKKLGAWPSVLVVSVAMATASAYVQARARRTG